MSPPDIISGSAHVCHHVAFMLDGAAAFPRCAESLSRFLSGSRGSGRLRIFDLDPGSRRIRTIGRHLAVKSQNTITMKAMPNNPTSGVPLPWNAAQASPDNALF